MKPPPPYAVCRFCGAPDVPGHSCDGRQGSVEALDLTDLPLFARGSDPETSHAAMAAFDRETMRSAMATVVRIHQQQGPIADYELRGLFAAAWAFPCCDHLYQQARSAARDQGLIRDSGQRRVNPATNRKQVVWEACDEAAPIIERCQSCGHLLRRKDIA
jgi:hypothetical protein